MSVMERPSAVPLPHWMSHCDCEGRPRRHKAGCYRIRAYEIHSRHQVEWVEGQRREAPSIDFPVRITVKVRGEIELDPVPWFQARLEDYVGWTDDDDLDWEKPLAYLHWCISEGIDIDLPGWADRGVVGGGGFDESEIDVRWDYKQWTTDHSVALHRALGLNDAGTGPPEPDPQLSLDL